MGKKGSWFSAIKRVFTHSSKEKLAEGTDKKSSKEKKKKGLGKLKHGEGHSFIPLFREPSSIEKILGEAEKDHQVTNYRPLTPPAPPKAPPERVTTTASPSPPPPPPPRRSASTPKTVSASASASNIQRVASPKASTPPRATSPPIQRVASPPTIRVPSPKTVQRRRPEPTLKEQHVCATKIQAAYRGYAGRRSYRALRGLVRLQAVVKGPSVKRQTANALKCMQLLVRVQTQIQSRRIQMLESQALQRQAFYKNDKDLESAFSKYLSENQDEWDDSTLTKEEIEARMQRKFEAIMKRERAMAYAYSHQPWKATPKTAQSALMDIQSRGFPYWWNWLEQRQTPQIPPPSNNPLQSPAQKTFHFTPTRPISSSPMGGFDFDTSTPRSTKSNIPIRTKLSRTPPPGLQQRFPRGSAANSPFNGVSGFRDDDSLTSCPAFSSVPRYMSPTASAKAKVRDSPNISVSVTDEPKRRMSFPLGHAFKKEQQPSVKSVGNMSVDSSVSSMPTTVGKKPFNRFV